MQRLGQAMDLFTRDAPVQVACCGALMNLAVDIYGKVRVRGVCACACGCGYVWGCGCVWCARVCGAWLAF